MQLILTAIETEKFESGNLSFINYIFNACEALVFQHSCKVTLIDAYGVKVREFV